MSKPKDPIAMIAEQVGGAQRIPDGQAAIEPAGEAIVTFTPDGSIQFAERYMNNPDAAAQAFISHVLANYGSHILTAYHNQIMTKVQTDGTRKSAIEFLAEVDSMFSLLVVPETQTMVGQDDPRWQQAAAQALVILGKYRPLITNLASLAFDQMSRMESETKTEKGKTNGATPPAQAEDGSSPTPGAERAREIHSEGREPDPRYRSPAPDTDRRESKTEARGGSAAPTEGRGEALGESEPSPTRTDERQARPSDE